MRVGIVVVLCLLLGCSREEPHYPLPTRESAITPSGNSIQWGDVARLDVNALKEMAPKRIKSSYPEVDTRKLFFDQIVVNYSDHPDIKGYNYETVSVRYYDLSVSKVISPTRVDVMSYAVQISDNYPKLGSVTVNKGMFPFLPGPAYLKRLNEQHTASGT